MEGGDARGGSGGQAAKRQRRESGAPPAPRPAPGGAAPRPPRPPAPAPPAYPRGAIKLVRVHDFMTYTGTVPIRPGPRLNLVLGPNGTGKSSLVCALCIGLGGSPKLLGRAENLKDYVNRNASEAWTEITLSGGPGAGDIVVRRDIKIPRGEDAPSYVSKWRLNGREATQAEVHELVREFNIQFDNLCQFLPQDRVVEFARMDQFELLQATQKAMGDSHLYEQHRELIAKSEEAKTKGVSLAALKRQLERLEGERRALERDAERFRKRQAIMRQLEDIRKKEFWLVCAAKQARADQDKHALEMSKTLLQRHLEGAKEDAAPLKAARQRAAALKGQLQRLGAAPNLAARRRQLLDKLQGLVDDITSINDRIGELGKKSEEWKAAIARLEADLGAKQRDLAALPPPVDNGRAIREVSQEMTRLQEQMATLDGEAREQEQKQTWLRGRIIAIKQAIAQLDSSRGRRLKAMSERNPGLEQAAAWLKEQERAGAFRGPVFGPLAVEITIKDPHRHARPVEAACRSMLFDFVATCREDEERITAELQRRGLNCAVRVPARLADAPYLRMAGPASNYAKYGVLHSMDELIEAPPLVMQALTSGPAALASSFLIADRGNVEALLQETSVRTVYTSTLEYRVIKASYAPGGGGGARDNGLQSEQLKGPFTLGGAGLAVDEQAKKTQQESLQRAEADLAAADEALRALEQRRGPLQRQAQEGQQRYQALVQEQQQSARRRATLTRAVTVIQGQLRAKRGQPDPRDAQPRLEAQRSDCIERHYAAQMELVGVVQSQWEGVVERGALELAQREADMQVRAVESATSERKEEERRLRDRVAKVEAMVKQSAAAAARARKEAELQAPLDRAGKLQERMDRLPDDSSELADLRGRLEAEVAGIVCNNPRALEEFQERQAAIAELTADVDREGGELETLNADIERIKGSWLPELQRLVGAIHTAFAAAFREIGCAGEVALDEGGGDGTNFAKFSIQIRVKFRDAESLQLLTGSRQSGGERSVSTILYLLALQGVTVTPFRVVDEINQGMDPVNERKVFDQLVAASCREGTPQCFLLTPKLLPDLNYGPDITVLQLMHGAIDDGGGGGNPSGWDIATMLGAAPMVAARG